VDNFCSYESSKQSSTKIGSALSYLNRSSSRTSHTRLAEVSVDGLKKYILAFVSGTTSQDLVWELGRNCPQTVDELMDVVANYAAGEEAVGAFFSYEGRKGKPPADDDEGPSRGPKNNKKKKKTRLFQREDIDDDLVSAMERKRSRGPLEGAIFDKMLKEPYPYHKGGSNHKLEDCRMLKKLFDGLGFKKDTCDDLKKREERRQGGRQRQRRFPSRPRLLHDLRWTLDAANHKATQEGAPRGLCGKDGSAPVPQLVKHPHHLRSR